MAPLCNDPKDIILVLNPARRRALVKLAIEITNFMRSEIVAPFQLPPGPIDRYGGVDRPSPKLLELRQNLLEGYDQWRKPTLSALKKICEAPDDPRRNKYKAPEDDTPTDTLSDSEALQELYHAIPTRLTTISASDRRATVSGTLLLMISSGHYSAYSRVFMLHLTSSFYLPLSALVTQEREIAQTLLQASRLSADSETQKRMEENQNSRRWKVGIASVAGAAVIGLTGGLAAPVVAGAIGGIMGGIGLGGLASFLGIFATNGLLMGSLFGALGGMKTGEVVDKYAKEVEDFDFHPINSWGPASGDVERRLRVTIGVNGWLETESDIVAPWRVLGDESDVYALQFELNTLMELGASLRSMVSSFAWSTVKMEILRRTVLATLWSALWPVYLLNMATSVDHPFGLAKNRSDKAGEVLADALINGAQGHRPVTLVGYSLGARVIYSCLLSLARRKAFGIVESVVLIGAPVPSDALKWKVMRSVVAGKIVNVFSERDLVLAFIYRTSSIQLGVAGLQKIDVDGIENLDLSAEVSGHLRYPDLVGQILKRTGFDVKSGSEIAEDDGIILLDNDIDPELREEALTFRHENEKSDLTVKDFKTRPSTGEKSGEIAKVEEKSTETNEGEGENSKDVDDRIVDMEAEENNEDDGSLCVLEPEPIDDDIYYAEPHFEEGKYLVHGEQKVFRDGTRLEKP